MTTRRSTRGRNATEEAAPPLEQPIANGIHSSASANTDSREPDDGQSPRKRKRSTHGDGSPDAEQAVAAEDNVTTASSPTKKGTARPRGRPPKVNAPSDNAAETRSTRALGATTAASAQGEVSSEHAMWLDPADAARLFAVLEQFDPELLHAPSADAPFAPQKTKGKVKYSEPSTLSEALDGRSITLEKLRSIALSLRRPVLDGVELKDEQAENSKSTRQRLMSATLVLSLIDELARTRRETQPSTSSELTEQTNERTPAVKKELSDILDNLLDGDDRNVDGDDSQRKKYALHMRLPTGDYFSQAVELMASEAKSLSTGAADLVEIEPPPSFADVQKGSARRALGQSPSLGSRLYRNASTRIPAESIEELRERRMGRVRPTSELYYGSYASFAPSYDSSESNISRATSALIWRTKMSPLACASRRAWTRREEEEGELGEWELVDAAEADAAAADDTSTSTLPDLDSTLDSDLIAAFLASAPSEADVQRRLSTNASLLAQLQDYQWTRLRRGHVHWKAQEKKMLELKTQGQGGLSRRSRAVEDEPSEEERAVVKALWDNLTALVAVRPREAGKKTSSLIPSDADLRAVSRSAALDPSLTNGGDGADELAAAVPGKKGYWGTLDGSTYGPGAAGVGMLTRPVSRAPRTMGPNIIVPTFESNTTARLDVNGENLSHTRAVQASRTGLPPGISADWGGHGLMERTIATLGRQVSHQASVTAGLAGMEPSGMSPPVVPATAQAPLHPRPGAGSPQQSASLIVKPTSSPQPPAAIPLGHSSPPAAAANGSMALRTRV